MHKAKGEERIFESSDIEVCMLESVLAIAGVMLGLYPTFCKGN
jgi:hypothetical protein